ncbi:MAG: hypothetical protein LUD82_04585 [Clostridiales bacterium]|nr:hypothetical protein [Clostridiales bacterium]
MASKRRIPRYGTVEINGSRYYKTYVGADTFFESGFIVMGSITPTGHFSAHRPHFTQASEAFGAIPGVWIPGFSGTLPGTLGIEKTAPENFWRI